MNQIKSILVLALCALALSTFAQDAPKTEPFFSEGETHLDISGTYTAAEPRGIERVFDTNARGGVFGVNVGVSYFPSLYLGVGADVSCTDLHDPGPLLIDGLTLTTTLRYPIGRFAPSITAGVGRDFDRGEYNFQAGPGVEFRFTRHLAAFTDARFKWQDRGEALLIRAGLRLAFK